MACLVTRLEGLGLSTLREQKVSATISAISPIPCACRLCCRVLLTPKVLPASWQTLNSSDVVPKVIQIQAVGLYKSMQRARAALGSPGFHHRSSCQQNRWPQGGDCRVASVPVHASKRRIYLASRFLNQNVKVLKLITC